MSVSDASLNSGLDGHFLVVVHLYGAIRSLMVSLHDPDPVIVVLDRAQPSG